MSGNIEAADRWTAEYAAQQRAAPGPWILQDDDEPDEPSYTPEEFAEMQAFIHEEEADNKRRLAQLWQLPNKRSRNN